MLSGRRATGAEVWCPSSPLRQITDLTSERSNNVPARLYRGDSTACLIGAADQQHLSFTPSLGISIFCHVVRPCVVWVFAFGLLASFATNAGRRTGSLF